MSISRKVIFQNTLSLPYSLSLFLMHAGRQQTSTHALAYLPTTLVRLPQTLILFLANDVKVRSVLLCSREYRTASKAHVREPAAPIGDYLAAAGQGEVFSGSKISSPGSTGQISLMTEVEALPLLAVTSRNNVSDHT